ncbi:SSI family serine proteinase inhibitor [Streptomyces sp. NPDC001380]|uniref:SSI family serine proteinase inhibitor n=1 Tax=Streptomyces sp. NPDC001380 TaxID=3364566 RepID=UPI0036D1B2AC
MPWSHTLAAAGLAAAALGLAAPPAAADPGGSPGGRLVLTLHSGEDVSGRVLDSVVLECGPDGGPHPDPAAACDALRAAGGDPAALRAQRGVMCPMVYAPVTGEATGTWDGRAVGFARRYANRCAAGAESGGVFRF